MMIVMIIVMRMMTMMMYLMNKALELSCVPSLCHASKITTCLKMSHALYSYLTLPVWMNDSYLLPSSQLSQSH